MTTNNAQLPKKRIEYIDALRGMTMILVVFSHVELTTFGFTTPTFINSLFMSFRMPLFFFVSGFIAYKASIQWDLQTWFNMTKKKFFIQLIPTLIFGIIYTYAYMHTDITDFVTNNSKLGYWFTIALLEIFIILYTTNLCLYSNNPQIHRRRMLIALTVISGCLFIIRILLKAHPTLNEVGNVLTLHHTFNYFQYFAFGYICSMYKDVFNKMLENKITSASIIILYAILFYIKIFHITPLLSDTLNIYKMFDIVIEVVIGYFGLLIVYNTFKTYQDSFTSEKRAGKILQFIGKRTLDIYLLHYFLLPHLLQVGKIVQNSTNTTLEITIGVIISLIVIALCLIISSILRTSPVLTKWLFGVKQKQ